MESEWYYSSDNERLGPCSWEHLESLASAGALNPGDLVWNESMSDWEPAETIPGLFPDNPARDRRKDRTIGPDARVRVSTESRGPSSLRRDGPIPSTVGESVSGFLDFGFRRHYTLSLVHFLWAAYVLISALALILCLLAAFIPHTIGGLVQDVVTTLYDPTSQTSDSGSRFSRRLGFFLALSLFLGFNGVCLRVFLETLSSQFQIIEALRELKLSGTGSRADRLES